MNISKAITIYLENYPKDNKEKFFSLVDSEADRDTVRAILGETMTLPMDWGTKSTAEIWQEAKNAMHERHPELSSDALNHLANYFAYNVK